MTYREELDGTYYAVPEVVLMKTIEGHRGHIYEFTVTTKMYKKPSQYVTAGTKLTGTKITRHIYETPEILVGNQEEEVVKREAKIAVQEHLKKLFEAPAYAPLKNYAIYVEDDWLV